jgi:hypothetical protein
MGHYIVFRVDDESGGFYTTGRMLKETNQKKTKNAEEGDYFTLDFVGHFIPLRKPPEINTVPCLAINFRM